MWDAERRNNRAAHIAVWMLMIGPIPDDHVLHHTCEVKRCVNPRHLELEEWGIHTSHHHLRDRCRHGHARDQARWAHGQWVCLPCQRDASRRSYLKKKEKRQSAAGVEAA